MKIYKSKISWGLVAFPMIYFIGMLFYMILNDEPLPAILLTNGIILVTVLFILYLLTNTDYRIKEGILYVQCGFIYRKHIAVSRIKSVKKTSSIISAPAASLDRIQITYDEFGILVISPRNKEEFTRDLLKINSDIIDGINT